MREHLRLRGLMTIGAPDYSGCRSEDFQLMWSLKKFLEQEMTSWDRVSASSALELSMGMSNDYHTAILNGSTSVRVGSTIFGARDYSAKK